MLLGANVEQDWPTLPSDLRRQLAGGAGKLLAKLHEASFPFFGELADRGPLPQSNR